MAVHSLPHAAGLFVNRVSEIAEISQQLRSADCRLLTLVGPGGIGKTRLAVQVAENCVGQFDDGVYFVPLQPLDSPAFIISALADAFGFQFRSGEDATQQILQYLREKALLLLLDNFEHLLEGRGLLSEMLEAAPDIKLLVTSREVLNLQEEWRYPVHGLHYPVTLAAVQPEAYSAVQLFVERARQLRGDLAVADEQAAVVRICQLVEGMPLALELAAAWAKALPTDEIASEIQHSLDFLSTSLRNVPQRHRSMQAILEQTWGRLNEEEQRVFQALAVFSGGFRREAAAAVAGVSLPVLSGLVDKSLLTRKPDGRYQIHELLRQYAQTRLETTPEESIRIHDLHSAYYARFLHELNKDMHGSREHQALFEIQTDFDNIRAAWLWAVEHSTIEFIDQLEQPLYRFYLIKSRFLEGIDAFERVVQVLDNGDPQVEILLARVLDALGAMYVRRGNELEKAREALERSWSLYSQNGVLPTHDQEFDPRVSLGVTYLLLGNISPAERLGQEAFRDHTRLDDTFNLARTCTLMLMLARVHGRYEEARHYAQQGYTCAVARSDETMESFCLEQWATISQLLGDTADAKQRLQASYVIREKFGDLKGMADTLTNLGRIALLEGNSAEAGRCYEQARTIYQDLGIQAELVISLEGMGNSAYAQGHYGEAHCYLREALQLSSQQIVSRTLSIFVGIGELFLQTGQRERGIELLALALHHPVSDQDTKERAQRLLSQYPAREVEQQTSTEVDFEAIAHARLDELLIPEAQNLHGQMTQADETLVEPLSERELAILTLIAAGRSNREIAEQLFLSVATVKWNLTHLFLKLDVQSRTQALARARQLKLLP